MTCFALTTEYRVQEYRQNSYYVHLLDRQKWDKTLVPVRSRRPRPRPRPGPRPKYQVVTKDQTDVRDGWENEGETQERRDKRGASGVVTEHGLHWCVTGS